MYIDKRATNSFDSEQTIKKNSEFKGIPNFTLEKNALSILVLKNDNRNNEEYKKVRKKDFIESNSNASFCAYSLRNPKAQLSL